MYALTPRHIGANINLDRLQFFIDYCNSSVLQGQCLVTGFVPGMKVLALSMIVELTNPSDPENPTIKNVNLTDQEKAFVEKLFAGNGWACFFADREKIEEMILKADDGSKDILLKILMRYRSGRFDGEIFILSTVLFKEEDPNKKKKEDGEEGATGEAVTDKVAEPQASVEVPAAE